ncbi:hypothetical protein ACTL6P_19405 [Endozoicomonas acroporae]|uniref:hypothetical protein n=1 Tax=Endozoicomonas acroporae TaxID=1701104 RepID=UPI000C780287|nr:hypothetical protein [Endozoicomonas acroporae]
MAVGDELIQKTTIVKQGARKIPILLAADVVKDRLAAYFHWNDKPSLVQALAVMIKHSIRPAELKVFCEKEGLTDAAQTIERLYQIAKGQNVESMEELQSIVLLDFMNQI